MEILYSLCIHHLLKKYYSIFLIYSAAIGPIYTKLVEGGGFVGCLLLKWNPNGFPKS
jgi:hypothetical protein